MPQFLSSCYQHADFVNNPAFRGWVFEFDVDFQLTSASTNNAPFGARARPPAGDCAGYSQPITGYIEFSSPADLVAPLQGLGAADVLWAKPALWCKKAYDFLCFWRTGDNLNMVAANATIGAQHSVKLDAVHELGVFLGGSDRAVESIRFDFLVPTGAEFEVGPVEGRLCGWKNLLGTAWPNRPDAASNVGNSCIVVADMAVTRA